MEYGIIFNPEIGEKGAYSLINLNTKEIIVSVGDVYIDRWKTKREKEMSDLTRKLKELTCKEYILKCIEEKTVFKYKYSDYRFVVGGIACSGQWYARCLDYRDGSIAVTTCYYEITKLPTELGTKIESDMKGSN